MKLITRLQAVVICLVCITGIQAAEVKTSKHALRRQERVARHIVAHMSVREKVGQVFNIRLESLCDDCWPMTCPTDTFQHAGRAHTYAELFAEYPAGAISLFGHNIVDSVQLVALTSYLHTLPSKPLLCIDEEGGTVARIGRNKSFDVPVYSGGMRAIGDTNDPEEAYQAGYAIGAYLHRYGLDINYAPLADACLTPDDSFLHTRLFGGDATQVGRMDSACMGGMQQAGVTACYKHFPGHGNTKDTHKGAAVLERTAEQVRNYELLPFIKGIESGVEMIMVAHISVPSMTGDSLPATLSPYMMDTLLRQELGFEGVIITDGLEMKAITTRYSSGEAAIQAFLAGADMLMLPANYREAFDAMVKAVESGRIPMRRLNESVKRIVRLKVKP